MLLRNVNFVIEQQRLKMRAVYEARLNNTLSHELLTPLNCIINLSDCLKLEAQARAEDLVQTSPDHTTEDGVLAEPLELIWSSSKILEYTIQSMISRQTLAQDNRVIKRSAKSRKDIEEAIQQLVAPFQTQMKSRQLEYVFNNNIPFGANEAYLANWDMLEQAVFHPLVNAIKFNKVGGTVRI